MKELEILFNAYQRADKLRIKVDYKKFDNEDYTFIHGFKYGFFSTSEKVDYYFAYFKGKDEKTEKAKIAEIKKQAEGIQLEWK